MHKQWDDVLKISQERNYPRNAAADSKQEFFFTSFSHLSAREYIFLSVYSLLTNLPKPAELTFCRQSTVRKYSITMNQMPDQASNFLLPSHPESGELAGGLRVEAELDGI